MIMPFLVRLVTVELLLTLVSGLYAQEARESNDPKVLIEQGNEALAQDRLHEAILAFQRAVDLDPSSAKGHEQLGVALTKEIVNGDILRSADPDVSERAEDNLKRAVELAPSATKPLMELSDLEEVVAERSSDPAERADRYRQAQDLLKQVLAVNPSKTNIYLKLAKLERSQFSPAIHEAKSHAGSKPGPLRNPELRHALQQQYGTLIDEAISNARKASETNGNSPEPLLLMFRLLEERALICETPEEYTTDMHEAEDWQRQFLSTGGHVGPAK